MGWGGVVGWDGVVGGGEQWGQAIRLITKNLPFHTDHTLFGGCYL